MVTSDMVGGLNFTLSTKNADPGNYSVTVSSFNLNDLSVSSPNVGPSFTLDESAPVRVKEGDWSTYEVLAGLAFTESIYLPIVVR